MNSPLSLQLQQTKQEQKTRHHSKARSWSIYSPIPTPTLWSQHSLEHTARALTASITPLSDIFCAQSIGQINTRIILSKYIPLALPLWRLLTKLPLSQLMEDVNNRKICVRASHWLTFMYNFAQGYDPDNRDLGLCRGLILVRVSVHPYFDQIVDGTTGFPAHLHRTIIGIWDTLSGDKGPQGHNLWPCCSDWQNYHVCHSSGVSHFFAPSYWALLTFL